MSGPIVLIFRILLALALYAFLGWALWTIWLDLKRAGSQTGIYKVRTIHLEVRIMNQAPSYRSFSQSEVILGRDQTCDITLGDESVSAHHAKLSFHHGQWWLEDLESTNGTRLNLDKLTTATVVTSGDEIKCGNAQLIVNLVDKSATPQ
jgi:pSer/pThr/pTyr-binding forkhead associated (FHA) protein